MSLGDERQVKDSEVVIDTQDVQVQDRTTAGSEKKMQRLAIGSTIERPAGRRVPSKDGLGKYAEHARTGCTAKS